jgi:hypothetical protein
MGTHMNPKDGAKRELAAFLGAVKQVFGNETAHVAAGLWIERVDACPELTFRQITIQTATQLANTAVDYELERK